MPFGEPVQDGMPDQLFHYTSPEGALGIIKSTKVWATMIHYLNDAQELQYAIEIARNLILDSDAASTSQLGRERIFLEFFDALKFVAVYTFSVTPHQDQLSQWRAYTSAKGGYAIGFRREHLETIAHHYGATLVRCIYDESDQLALLRPVIDELLVVAGELPEGSRGMDLYRAYAERFLIAATAIKHPAFHEEQEWRLISGLGVHRSIVNYRTSGSLVVPYCEWSIKQGDAYPISKIVVGPNTHRDLAARSLRHLTGTVFGWPAVVEFSDAPYRSF